MNQELPLEKPEIFEASVASTEASLRTEAHFHMKGGNRVLKQYTVLES